MAEYITNIDFDILNAIQNIFACKALNIAMPIVTFLGELGAAWVICGVVLVFTKKYRKCGIVMLASLLMCLLIGNIILKPAVARIRPFEINQAFNLLINKPSGYSFPSGHTFASFTAATVLFFTNKKFGFAALPLAILIAFSRLYLYVHFPSDVIAGIVLGILTGIAVWMFFKSFIFKNELKNTSD